MAWGIYDVKLAGESVTHPHLRVCGFRSEHYMEMPLVGAIAGVAAAALSRSVGVGRWVGRVY